jgi:tripartite ATP-independent transporter DctP family solute receptor
MGRQSATAQHAPDPRKLTRRGALAAAASAALAGDAWSKSAPAITLTAVDAHRAGYPTVEAVLWMAREIERETQGRIGFRQYPSGQLGSETDTINLTRYGVLDICRVNIAGLNNMFPLTRPLAMPYVFRDVAHMRRVLDGPVGRNVLAGFERRGLVGLGFYDAGVRSMYNARRAIHTPADMHGLKVRVQRSDIFIDMLNLMGANATPIAFSEVYTGLQTHLIDGAENNWSTFESVRHYEVARFYSNTLHSYSPEALLMSKARFERFSPADRELIRQKAAESVPVMRRLWDENEAKAKAKVLADGVALNEADLPAFHRAVEPLRARFANEAGVARILRGVLEHE